MNRIGVHFPVVSSAATSPIENRALDVQTFKNSPWDESKDHSHLIRSLQEGSLVYSCSMRDFLKAKNKTAIFNNEVQYGILEYQNSYIAVVYKPKDVSDAASAYAEKIAYDVYERTIAPYTGHHVIPPTVVRTMSDGKIASFQFFVETDDSEDMWNSDFRSHIFSAASKDLIQEMSVFNGVFNNWDRHPGNYLATEREGRIYLASIDNEGIENRAFLPRWGERSYIPSLFTEDPRSNVEKEIFLPSNITFVEFKDLLAEYGFKETPRMRNIYNNTVDRGGHPSISINKGALMIRYHQGNTGAFPLPKKGSNSTLLLAYAHMNKEVLDECFHPLVQLDPERFISRTSSILARRDMFLAAEKEFREKEGDIS